MEFGLQILFGKQLKEEQQKYIPQTEFILVNRR